MSEKCEGLMCARFKVDQTEWLSSAIKSRYRDTSDQRGDQLMYRGDMLSTYYCKLMDQVLIHFNRYFRD